MNSEEICIVVPAFNEEHSLRKVIESLREHFQNIVVVDDCSSDNTSIVAQNLGCLLIELPINLGIGGAVQAGIKYAHNNNYSAVVQFDGDGQHLASEISKLISVYENHGADLIIGSRWKDGSYSKSSKSRRLGIVILSYLLSKRIGMKITDPTSGFRLMSQRAIEVFASNYEKDFPEINSIIVASALGLEIREVPVKMVKREFGKSSITTLRSIYYMILETLSILVGVKVIK